jgi:23S rRNA (guanosine2251-2'-O)-methyltransferase
MTKSSSQKLRNKSFHTKKTGPRSHPNTEQLVWGIHPVHEALKACPQAIREIGVDKDKSGYRLEQILELAQKHAIPVSTLPGKTRPAFGKSDELPDHESTQGVSARIILPTLTLDELLDKLSNVSGPPLLLALDSIQDPHNLGAIIRSAVAAGVNGIILPKDRSASITGTVIKISAGSVFHIDICRVTNLVSSFKVLKENGIWIFGTTKDASRTIYDTDFTNEKFSGFFECIGCCRDNPV